MFASDALRSACTEVDIPMDARRFDLGTAMAAHEEIESGRVKGKFTAEVRS
ncbi:hypothetical protein [Variovorax sp. W2I14]|uniref:hypothetical protein n=1 Tax=Variovorax sp. W2I14 TaxID=3042290 RepID=UPI003D1F9714